MKKYISIVLSICMLCGCVSKQDTNIYKDESLWAYKETDVENKEADVFFIAPTVYLGDEEHLNWEEYDEQTKESFVGAINMEKGIYDDNARFFAPFYHQASLASYSVEGNDSIEIAYKDVKEAFEYYLKHYNDNRPIVLAGFSQGAQLSIMLMEEYSETQEFVACYAIGWRFTQEDQQEHPNVHFATKEDDTNVIIAFNSEDESVEESIMIPSGTKTYAMNPLNWKTDGTIADHSLNEGACFTDYEGNINAEVKEFTGAYIDDERGALKVTDVNSEDYPGVLFEDGIYHIYDYMFFYRNLEKNVQTRIEAFKG